MEGEDHNNHCLRKRQDVGYIAEQRALIAWFNATVLTSSFIKSTKPRQK
jgi:hypothetical protein